MNNKPAVSILIPCRNEAGYISACLQSILNNSYPKNLLEIIVVDGQSEDKTKELIEVFRTDGVNITIVENPKRIQSHALNLALLLAKGEVIMRLDAHCTYSNNYIEDCISALYSTDAASVGGVWKIVPRGTTKFDWAAAAVLANPFGVGNAHYRVADSKGQRFVDTVPFFCMKRAWIEKVGDFNEKVGPSEDVEFYKRLRLMGGKILLLYNVSSTYYARSRPLEFSRHNFRNGIWAVLPFIRSKTPGIRPRHLAPLFLLLNILITIFMAIYSPNLLWVPGILLLSYILFIVFAATKVCVQFKKHLLDFPIVIIAFFTLHISYGLGSLYGVFLCVKELSKLR